MRLTDEEKRLVRHEGIELRPYRCPAGKLTIGVGRNIEDVGITEEEAIYLLKNDIARCRKELTSLGMRDLDPVRQEVMVNMLFNLGLPRMTKFIKMLDAVRLQRWDRAADEMLNSLWAKQVGVRAQELARMMREGR